MNIRDNLYSGSIHLVTCNKGAQGKYLFKKNGYAHLRTFFNRLKNNYLNKKQKDKYEYKMTTKLE